MSATKRTPLIDRLLGELSGRMLLRLTKRAMKRGDTHEARHCYEALSHGASDGCIPGMCSLDQRAIAEWDAAFDRQFLRNATGEPA